MKRLRSPKLLATAAVLIGGLAIVGGLAVRRPVLDSAVTTPAKAHSTRSLHVSAGFVPAASAVLLAPVALPSVPERQLASAQIRQVLPSVQYAQKDWRQFSPDKLTVEAVPGCPVEFEVQSVKMGGPRGDMLVWRGAAPGIPGSMFISVASEHAWTGSLIVPGADEQRIFVGGDSARVETALSGICGNADVSPLLANALPASTVPVMAAAPTSINTSDVMYFYTPEVELKWIPYVTSGDSVQIAMDRLGTLDMEICNQYLVQSGVNNLTWRYVGSYLLPTDYALDATMEGILASFAGNSTVSAQMDRLAADQAVLRLQEVRTSTQGGVAIANMPGHHAYVPTNGGAETLAHEMGHNFNCHHDRQTLSASDNDGKYYYGYRFTWHGHERGTIMSYANSSIPYFSNPDIQISSSLIEAGTSELITIGAIGAKAADNARVLREGAAAMAATRSPESVPIISTQPTGATITAGQSLTLSVTATG
jgi:hypothetical protein